MLSGSEKYYDDIYSAIGKDYVLEAEKIHEFIQKHMFMAGKTLLDVACGTGTHAGLLCKYYGIVGMDLNQNMLKVAREKHPEIHFLKGDMKSFDLNRKFDAVTCLFSAIGYMKTKAELRQAIQNLSRHLLPGGVLLVEPWFTPEQWTLGRVSTIFVDKPDVKIVRMSHSGKKSRVAVLEFQYLIGTSQGLEHLREHHEFGLFTHEEYMDAFTRARLNVTHDPEGVDGRGLYIGKKPI
jgi:ubiquinone/menaquinone biosynthesis C-methylase UbiE